MRIATLALLAALTFPVSAQTVYKCRGAKGEPVYQSFPCGGVKPPEETWSGEYRPRTNSELWADYNRDQAWKLRQQRETRARASIAPYRIDVGQHQKGKELSNRAACVYARNEYNRVQADFKLNRNINLLRSLESDIRRYCEVRP